MFLPGMLRSVFVIFFSFPPPPPHHTFLPKNFKRPFKVKKGYNTIENTFLEGRDNLLVSGPVLWIRNDFSGSGFRSGFNLNFGSGFGSGLFMKNTFELQVI
jgi:hypothetical protein